MKPAVLTELEAVRQCDLKHFGALIANPSEIDAVVRGPVVINRSNWLLEAENVAVIMRSGAVIEIRDANEARALWDAFERGLLA